MQTTSLYSAGSGYGFGFILAIAAFIIFANRIWPGKNGAGGVTIELTGDSSDSGSDGGGGDGGGGGD